ALVTLTGIQVFFDILIPNGETPDKCEEKVSEILSGTVKSFKMEHIKAFPFRGDHTEKKSYLRIYTNGTGERKKAIQTIQENNFETASNDMWSFHRKDIETQSRKLGEFAEVLDLNNNVFTIGMTLHWKDDPKSLKQICLIDVETEPDPRCITIICGNQENLLKALPSAGEHLPLTS
ncbi:4852_t:CDS:2, partial [Funneliformis geosporum]